jgi:sulfite reductase (ferredoxin)
LKLEFPQYKENREITIKKWLYECLWTTQHVFNWFSRNVYQLWKLVAPALQVLFGGIWEMVKVFSDKVIKIPSRRGPDALRFILK